VSSLCFISLAGLEGNIHLESLLNKSKIELSKLKNTDFERFEILAQYDLTKSLAYLYKIFEEMGNMKGDADASSTYLEEIFNASTLTSFLKFYLKDANCMISFISCILTIEPFSCFSHDCLHNASLVENIFTRKIHESLKLLPGFKSKYLQLQGEIKKIKDEIRMISEEHSKDARPNYNVMEYKADLGTKIDKILGKILNSGQIKMQNFKNRQSMLHRNEDSGFLSINENDMSRGAFEIGKFSY
jgi:hypothetical protein